MIVLHDETIQVANIYMKFCFMATSLKMNYFLQPGHSCMISIIICYSQIGSTPLHRAVVSEHIDVVTFLMDMSDISVELPISVSCVVYIVMHKMNKGLHA